MLELLDAGVDKPTQRIYEGLVEGLVDGRDLLGVRNVRGVKSGGMFPPPLSPFIIIHAPPLQTSTLARSLARLASARRAHELT